MKKQAQASRTATLNQKQKHDAKQARQTALLWLARQFPAAFDNSVQIRPLKLGVMIDILAYADDAALVGISKSKLREAVVMFTRRIEYLVCLKSREMRIDLQGNCIEEVTEAEAAQAVLKLKKQVEKLARNAQQALLDNTLSADTVHANDASNCGLHVPTSLQGSIEQGSSVKTIVKHKVSRAYDPEAVARLKEKLGLSKKAVHEAT